MIPLQQKVDEIVAWLAEKWHARQRAVDVSILWPVCKDTARDQGLDLDTARSMFMVHCAMDEAWASMGTEAAWEIVRKLE